MKSPLVDALRNATGRTGEETPGPETDTLPVPDDQPEVGPKQILLDEIAPDADEFCLLEATVAGRVIRQAENDTAAGTAAPEVVDAEHRAGHQSSRASAETLARIRVPTRGLSIARAGRFSPLICLLLGISSTGAYLLYQVVGGGEASTGLAALAAKPGTDSGRDAAVIPAPQGPLERFPLIESGRRMETPGAMPAQALQRIGQGSVGDAGPSAVAELAPQPGDEVRGP